jgi:hypothetical protein
MPLYSRIIENLSSAPLSFTRRALDGEGSVRKQRRCSVEMPRYLQLVASIGHRFRVRVAILFAVADNGGVAHKRRLRSYRHRTLCQSVLKGCMRIRA